MLTVAAAPASTVTGLVDCHGTRAQDREQERREIDEQIEELVARRAALLNLSDADADAFRVDFEQRIGEYAEGMKGRGVSYHPMPCVDPDMEQAAARLERGVE